MNELLLALLGNPGQQTPFKRGAFLPPGAKVDVTIPQEAQEQRRMQAAQQNLDRRQMLGLRILSALLNPAQLAAPTPTTRLPKGGAPRSTSR